VIFTILVAKTEVLAEFCRIISRKKHLPDKKRRWKKYIKINFKDVETVGAVKCTCTT